MKNDIARQRAKQRIEVRKRFRLDAAYGFSAKWMHHELGRRTLLSVREA
jgi:hypothetical protein